MEKIIISHCPSSSIQLEYTAADRTLAIVFKDKKSIYDVLTNVLLNESGIQEAIEKQKFEYLILESVTSVHPTLNFSLSEYAVVMSDAESKSGAITVCNLDNKAYILDGVKLACAVAGVEAYLGSCVSRLAMGLGLDAPIEPKYTNEVPVTNDTHAQSSIPALFGLSSESLGEILNVARAKLALKAPIHVDWIHSLIEQEAVNQKINKKLTEAQLFVISNKILQLV